MRFLTPWRAIAVGCLLAWGAVSPAAAETLAVDGGSIAYEICGTGEQAIVLLHDGILHGAAYDEAWPLLCGRFRVVRYDRRGYGASTPAAGPYRPVDDLGAVMAATGLSRATLVGASAGGGVAVDFALDHPEAVDGLVLVGPWVSGFGASFGMTARSLKLLALFKLGAVNLAVRDRYILTRGAKAERRRVAALLKAHPGNILAGTQERYRAAARPRLGQVTAPMLILVGAADIKDVGAQAEALEAAAPGARRVVVPDSGHFLYLERPAVFAQLVTAFVDARATGVSDMQKGP